MKKIVVSMVLVVALAIGLFGCLADGFDFSAMSDEEVTALIESARQELLSRGVLRSGELLQGIYVVGKDIASGVYNAVNGEHSTFSCYYYLFPSKEVYDLAIQYSLDITPDVVTDKSTRLDLTDGMVLVVDVGSMFLEQQTTNMLAP